MCRRRLILPSIAVLILLFTGSLSAQTLSWPRESLRVRVERIVNAGKERGVFVTYENRFLEGVMAKAITTSSNDIEEWLILSLKDTPLAYKAVSTSRFVIVRRAETKPTFGYLAGKVTDEFGRFLPGATIRVQGDQRGSMTGMNGDYSLSLPSGQHVVEVRFLGYKPTRVENIDIKEKEITRLDIALKESEVQLEEIVVTTRSLESTIAGALHAQRNTPYISNVLSSQQINRSASNTVHDALKLIPGISINENNQVIIRGAGGRWNKILLDGIPLPNHDPSYKIFSFDLIPVALADNIRLIKSSTPDIPAGFAGGITEIVTKDIPERNYTQVSASYEFNTLSTFNPQRERRKEKFDMLGFDDGSREIPEAFLPVTPGYPERMPANNTLFPAEHFAITERKSLPSQHYNITIGRTRALEKTGDRFGLVVSLSYQNTSRQSSIHHTQRGRWDYIRQYTGNLNGERNFQTGITASFPFRVNKTRNKAVIGYTGNFKRFHFMSNEAIYSYDNKIDTSDPASRIYQTLERNRFDGSMVQYFPFGMVEHRLRNKIRLAWGVRGDYEDYRATIPGEQTVAGDNRKWHASPSANMIYTPRKDLNWRLSLQRSIIRPNSADHIPYPVYDTYLLGTAINGSVSPSTVQSADILVEKQINTRDLVSVGLFYRHIDRPIERTTYLYRFDEPMYVLQNSDEAYYYGIEIDTRKHLDFMENSRFLEKVQLTAGFILTRSSVKGKRIIIHPQGEGENRYIETESMGKRPLEGQMPYQLNVGISYSDKRVDARILFNRNGRQLFLLGENAYQHEYQAPLNSLESSISYRFPTSNILLKLSGSNLLNSTRVFYTNTADDYVRDEHDFPTDKLLPGKTENYDKGRDPIIHEVTNGRNFTIPISRIF